MDTSILRFKNIIDLSFQKELKKYDTFELEYTSISKEKIIELSEKIKALPERDINLLFFRYILEESIENTRLELNIQHPKEESIFLLNILSRSIGLNNKWVDKTSMEKSLEIILKEETINLENVPIPIFSKEYNKKIKSIGLAPKRKTGNLLKKIAIFFLILSLTFTSILALNPKARETFYNWTIRTFSDHSEINFNIEESNPEIDIEDIEIGWVPDRFEFVERQNMSTMGYSVFSDSNNQALNIIFIKGENVPIGFDTEDSTREDMVFKNNLAMIWTKKNRRTIFWKEESIGISISGELTKSELIRIAEELNIKK